MNQIWQTVLAIIGCVGGAGVIIAFIAKWLSELISDRLLQKKQAQIDLELEKTKKSLELEIEKYRRKSEKLTFVTRIQFETEFNAYRVLFQNLYDFGVYTGNLFPVVDQIPKDKDEATKEYKRRYHNYCDSFNAFSAALEQNAPFIPKEIYESFVELRRKAHSLGCMYPDIRINADPRFDEDNFKLAHENYQGTREFNDMIAEIKNEVRTYLGTLKVQD